MITNINKVNKDIINKAIRVLFIIHNEGYKYQTPTLIKDVLNNLEDLLSKLLDINDRGNTTIILSQVSLIKTEIIDCIYYFNNLLFLITVRHK